MKVNEFNKLVSKYESKKKHLTIAQISEVTKVINDLTDG